MRSAFLTARERARVAGLEFRRELNHLQQLADPPTLLFAVHTEEELEWPADDVTNSLPRV